MASTYTTGFSIEKIGSGEQAGSWGTTSNHNWDIVDRLASYKAVALSDASTATLTVREASPGSGTENLQDGMYRAIKFTGSLSQDCTVTIAPNTAPAWFIIENAAGDDVILSQGSGANVTVQNGKNVIVYCDGAGGGAAVVDALADLQIGTLEVTGVAAIDGALTQGGASQFNSTITVGVNDTGYDVKMFGATSGAYMLWDESADDLILAGAAGLSVAGGSALASVDVTGVATAATFEPDGDTAASDNAAIGYTAAEGLILTGQGSTNDVTIKNDADAEVMGVLTGTTTAAFTGEVTGTGFTGTLDGILGSGTPAAATVTTLTTSGIASIDDTTDTTSGTSGSIHTDGGVGIAKDLFVGVDSAIVGHASIGVNAVASTRALTVAGATDGTGSSIFVGYNSSLASKFSIRDDGYTSIGGGLLVTGATQLTGAVTVGVDDTGYDVKFFGATSGSYMLWDESTDDLILGGASKLGIGTASPAHALHVLGGTSAFTVNPSSTLCVIGTASAAATNSSLYIDTKGTGSIIFRYAAGGTESMRITGAGLVGIGTTSPGSTLTVSGADTAGVLYVTQTAAGNNAARIIGSHASFTGNVLQPWTVRAASTAFDLIECVTNNGTEVPFRVRGDGQVTSSAGAAFTGTVTVGSEGGAATTNVSLGLNKAWVRVYGTAVTVTDSFNMTSVTDSGVGLYAPVIANNMNDTLYAVVTGADDKQDGGGIFVYNINDAVAQATTGFGTTFKKYAYTLADANQNAVSSVLGDLA